MRPLSELMGAEGGLDVYAVNGDTIPFDGWVEVTVNILWNDSPNLSIQVPFLVS